MYSSNSQNYLYTSNPNSRSQSRRNQIPPPQYNHDIDISGMAPPVIPDTAESIQRDFDRYMRETSGSKRPGQLHSHGGYTHTSGMAPPMIPDTAESIQRDFDRYMRETGSQLPLPNHVQSSSSVPPSNGNYNPKHYTTMAPSPHNHGAVQSRYPRDAGSKTSRSNYVQSPSPTPVSHAHVSPSKPRAPVAQNTAEYVQLEREFELYMRETAPPALLPSPTPTNYTLVPQEAFSRPTSILIPPIEFTPKGWHVMGVNLPYRLSDKQDIEGARGRVFVPSQGMREIIVKIQWPGYTHERYTFEVRIETKEGNVTRGELRDMVCGAVVEFSMMLKRRNAYVAKGYTRWTIGKTGLNVDRFFVARLLHRGLGGNYFQPEIWVPTPREK